MRRRNFIKLSLAGAFALAYQGCARFPLAPGRSPIQASLREALQATLRGCVERHEIPGAVALVQSHGKQLFHEAFGVACLREESPTKKVVAMRAGTRFDLASLTKMVATTTAILTLRDRGLLDLDDTVGKFLKPIADSNKKEITLRQCLTHCSGLAPFRLYYKELCGREAYLKAITADPFQYQTGAKWVYSDLGFILLGLVVEAVAGEPLDDYARKHIFEPLGMKHTGYVRMGADGKRDPTSLPAEATYYAATERCPWRKRLIIGEVHDENAWALGGVAGHAGLFSTAEDLSKFCEMLLGQGEARGARVLAPDSVALLCRPQILGLNPLQCIGWRLRASLESPIGFLGGARAFGHTGFTGTNIWIDPDNQVFSILLTNAVHPERARMQPANARRGVARQIVETLKQAPEKVMTGLDVLEAEGFARLRGKRVAVVTNQSGVNAKGAHGIDLMTKAGVKVTAIFTPEHGFGVAPAGAKVGDSKRGDIPIYSLYGPRRAPEEKMAGLFDVLVYDIQDIGARFYTYIWTLFSAQAFCAKAGRPLMVLDRPNPLGGAKTEGPVLEPAFSSSVGLKPLPTRYGLTCGELATLFNQQGWLEGGGMAALEVVKMQGWRREMRWRQIDLPWIPPSPNIPTWDSVAVYPGTCIFEGTSWSEGRGTDVPFQMVGGPGIDEKRLAKELNKMDLPGCRFLPMVFTPRPNAGAPKPKLEGKACGGVFVRVDDCDAFDSVKTGLAVLMTMRAQAPDSFKWSASHFDRLMGTDTVRKQIEAGASLKEITKPWAKGLEDFEKLRRTALIYNFADIHDKSVCEKSFI
ncbi:MAG: DUF1343 domain-containing protein [Candidatus Sumerlaeota bacterium]|nr:DUF1343 domain-containing protein [Candidatus Sumerlaeota bacterium]